MAENPLVTQSYVDRVVGEAREDADDHAAQVAGAVSDLSVQLAELSKSLTYRIGGAEAPAT